MKHSFFAAALLCAAAACGGGGGSETTTSSAGGSSTTTTPSGTGGTGGGGADTGGAGGGGPICSSPADCPVPSTPCVVATCKAGHCGADFVPALVAVGDQTPGDCLMNGCDGSGNAHVFADDADPPDDQNPCTIDACSGGTPTSSPAPAGTACGNGQTCDGKGTCFGCAQPSDCPGLDTPCRTRTCVALACGETFAPAGTPADPQTTADCQRSQCDGNGNIVEVADDLDLPVDGKDCTTDLCTSGVPSNPKLPAGAACAQNGGSKCDGDGTCVQCLLPADCGADTPCQTRTCVLGVCGVSKLAAGTVVANPTAGDCHSSQCDGNGNVTAGAVDNADVPVDDKQCTGDVCAAGTPSNPPLAVGAVCSQNGGTRCDGSGNCVQCLLPADCGADTPCQTHTCAAGACGVHDVALGTFAGDPTPGDCRSHQCDGNGGVATNAVDDNDKPIDGKPCTSDVCTVGVPSNPPLPAGAACGANGSSKCDGAGNCAECITAVDCGTGTACKTFSCNAGACSSTNTAAGTVVANLTVGDCHSDQCDGSGNLTVNAVDNNDEPADDGNSCTGEICAAGAPQHPSLPAGTACNQNGGTACDGAGVCAGGPLAPSVAGTMPSDGAVAPATTGISVTFTQAMSPSTLTGQTALGACTGSIQVSANDFATCVAFTAAAPTMTAGDTVATLTPQPGLLVNRAYKIRVTTAAADASNLAMAATYTSTTGFGASDPLSVVISQVYGGGGNTGSTYKNDFIELHNRGAAAVNLSGWSVQYASATGSSWQVTALSGQIQPGAYYLVQEGAGAAGISLPTPEATGSIAMAMNAGKVALVSTTNALSVACPTGAPIVDLVGFGATASCYEGSGPTPAPSASLSAQRATGGCLDQNQNATDFAALTTAPRNGSTAALCPPTHNELGDGGEADWCATQSPLTLSVTTGVSTGAIYGRLYEAGVTSTAGASTNVLAQLGYGPATANPQYEAGWTWTQASFNVQVNNDDDEYQASFVAPAVGSYLYVYRFSLDNGASFTYCGKDGGAGSNANLTFDLEDQATLTVNP